MKKIELSEVRHIANLAKLKFNEDEELKMQEDLSNILSYMEVLENIDTSNVEINEILSTNMNVMREDKEIKFENVDKILENSNKIDRFIVIPE